MRRTDAAGVQHETSLDDLSNMTHRLSRNAEQRLVELSVENFVLGRKSKHRRRSGEGGGGISPDRQHLKKNETKRKEKETEKKRRKKKEKEKKKLETTNFGRYSSFAC